MDIDFKVLKTIFRFKKPVKVGRISRYLSLPHSTIGSCVKRLEKTGYVIYERYKPVSLTEKGRDVAIESIRHSRLLEMLLINEIGLDKKVAHEESEKFNLPFSCEIINLICEKYGHPKECPCGESILDSIKCNCEKNNNK